MFWLRAAENIIHAECLPDGADRWAPMVRSDGAPMVPDTCPMVTGLYRAAFVSYCRDLTMTEYRAEDQNGHAIHFLRRLDRATGEAAELALQLYHDPEMLRSVL